MYIIPTTCISLIVVLITAILQIKNEEEPVTKKDAKTIRLERQKKRKVAFIKVIQELTIIFFSAILAIWLTDVFEEQQIKERVSSLMLATSNANVGQISHINGVLLDISEINKASGEADYHISDEDIIEIASAPIKNWSNMTEAILYNEMVISTIDPMSYTMMIICLENNERTIESLKEELEKEELDKEAIAEYVASICFYSSELSLQAELLSEDVEFQIPMLAYLEYENMEDLMELLQTYSDYNTYNEIYLNDIHMLEDLFGVDLSEWEERPIYN